MTQRNFLFACALVFVGTACSQQEAEGGAGGSGTGGNGLVTGGNTSVGSGGAGGTAATGSGGAATTGSGGAATTGSGGAATSGSGGLALDGNTAFSGAGGASAQPETSREAGVLGEVGAAQVSDAQAPLDALAQTPDAPALVPDAADGGGEAGPVCPPGSAWCGVDGGHACLDITYDSQNCGGCGNVCTDPGTECCDGVCAATASYATDPKNCGVCGNVCPAPGDSSDACLFFDQCKKPSCGKDVKGAVVCNPELVTACTGCLVGCCKGDVCMSGSSDSACGMDGMPCTTCTGGEHCMGGTCECMDFTCGI
jgi:hypothetical protein